MIELNTSKFRLPPYNHQLAGVKTLLKKKTYGLFWKMRLGKTKAIIDAACTLFDCGELDAVVIVCPAQVKDVWTDRDLGEIKKHAWIGEKYEHNARGMKYLAASWGFTFPCFIVTSFEFLRQEDAFREFPMVKALLQALKGKRVWLVVDEASNISNVKSLQTKATYQLRQGCERVTELDGTPAGNSTLDLFSKFMILDKKILGYSSFSAFKKSHAIERKVGVKVKTRWGSYWPTKIVGYQNLELITERTKDFCEYLSNGLDMPEFIPSFFTVPLTPKTWSLYTQLRDELVAEMDSGPYLIKTAASKLIRLGQLCSGFLGGVNGQMVGLDENLVGAQPITAEISSEATDSLLDWLETRITEDPLFKVVVWCRWVPEIERLYTRCVERFSKTTIVMRAYGGASDQNVLHPDYPDTKTGVICIAQPQASRYGVNYGKAETVVYLSQGYDLVTRQQSQERVQVPNTRKTTALIDVIVTGPDGQRTITHDVVKVLLGKENLATRTTDQWKKVLMEV